MIFDTLADSRNNGFNLMMNDGKQQSTFFVSRLRNLWNAPALDRPAQFAAIRTDNEFNVIGEPEVFYCKPADDYLPQPGAVLITGITRRRHGRKEKTKPRLPPVFTRFYRTEDLYSGLQQCAFRRRSHTQRFLS